jgi:hypothetical protein
MVKAMAAARAEVKRGSESWNYIYIFLGFALTIEGTIIQMLQLDAVSSLILYAAFGALTFYLFICDGWFQNKLAGWKNSYEERWHSIG